MRTKVPAVILAVVLSAVMLPAASATTKVVDGYCSPSGDYCTSIVKKADGTIVFKIRAFADYFGRATACVTKETRACRSTSPGTDAHDLFVWSIRWQGHYPKEDPGRYKVRWLSGGEPIGPALYFRRG
jgi:hypothetical protein